MPLGQVGAGFARNYAIGINDYNWQSQYRYDAEIDMTWYPRKHR